MSKFSRKTSLALAVAAAFALATPAMAATVTSGGATTSYSNVVASTDYTATTPATLSAIHINIVGTDQIIGRTTGFSVRLTLANGAKFGAAVTGANATVGAAAVGGWTAAVAAGGATTDNYVVISLSPGAPGDSITTGDLLDLAGISIKGSSAPVGATVDFFDPVTTLSILNSINFTALSTANPLDFAIGPQLTNPGAAIDVGGTAGPSKTGFSADGTVNGPRVSFFDAGQLQIGVTTGVLDSNGNPFLWAVSPPAAADDTGVLTVTGNFGAFAGTGGSVYLATGGAACAATPPGGSIAGTLNAQANSVTFASTAFSTLNGAELCFAAPSAAANLQVIAATPVNTSLVMTRTATTSTASGTAAGAAMAYNGPVETVYTFNPGSNSNQQSILRVSNTGAAGGEVTVTGTDDAGNPSAGSVSFNLAAGASIQLNSSDLEDGNAAKGVTGALGHGTGKWILTVTGQIPSMEVTNLNRNNGSGTLNNLGTPVDGKH